MRTNVEIDDELMRLAMAASGKTTKKEAVEEALRLVVQLRRQRGILKWFGKVQWDGDLDAMREGRFLDSSQAREEAECEPKSPASIGPLESAVSR